MSSVHSIHHLLVYSPSDKRINTFKVSTRSWTVEPARLDHTLQSIREDETASEQSNGNAKCNCGILCRSTTGCGNINLRSSCRTMKTTWKSHRAIRPLARRNGHPRNITRLESKTKTCTMKMESPSNRRPATGGSAKGTTTADTDLKAGILGHTKGGKTTCPLLLGRPKSRRVHCRSQGYRSSKVARQQSR